MKRTIQPHGFKKHQSQERLNTLIDAWPKITLTHKIIIFTKVVWYSRSHIIHSLDNLRCNYSNWIDRQLHPVHWVKIEKKKIERFQKDYRSKEWSDYD